MNENNQLCRETHKTEITMEIASILEKTAKTEQTVILWH